MALHADYAKFFFRIKLPCDVAYDFPEQEYPLVVLGEHSITTEELVALFRLHYPATRIFYLYRTLGEAYKALDAGVDDVLEYAGDATLLSKRLEAQMRFYQRRRVVLGPLTLLLAQHTAWLGGERLHLSKKLWMLLETLVLSHDQLLSYEFLANRLQIPQRRLRFALFELRLALGSEAYRIETHRGRGVLFRSSD